MKIWASSTCKPSLSLSLRSCYRSWLSLVSAGGSLVFKLMCLYYFDWIFPLLSLQDAKSNRQYLSLNVPQRSQIQRYPRYQWKRLPASWSYPRPYWFSWPASGTSSRRRLWPEPRLQTRPAPESGPSAHSPYQPGERNRTHVDEMCS